MGGGVAALLGAGLSGEVVAALMGAASAAAITLAVLRRSARSVFQDPSVAVMLPRLQTALAVSGVWLVGLLGIHALVVQTPAIPGLRTILIGSHSALCASVGLKGVALGKRFETGKRSSSVGGETYS